MKNDKAGKNVCAREREREGERERGREGEREKSKTGQRFGT